MKILIDGDGCPVIKIAEEIAKKYLIKTVLICDTSHIISSDYSEVFIVDKGTDSADFYLINKCQKGDIVITQDYGVAAMALSKGCYGINQNGRWYTNDNIDKLLMTRHIAKKVRNSNKKVRLKGPSKRTDKDDENFKREFERLILYITNEN